MRRLFGLLLFLSFVALSAQAFSQNFDLQRDRMPLAELKGQFRFHAGDDPRYAAPSFDDSGWSLLKSDQSWYSQGYKNYSGFGWYRFRVTVPASQGPLSLFIPYLWDSYAVYGNGRLIGHVGGFPPQPRVMYGANQVFAIPASTIPADRTVVFAVRVWRSPMYGIINGAGFRAAPVLGEADAIRNWADLQIHHLFWLNAQVVFMALVGIGSAILGLVLFAVRRTELEYMWYGIGGVFWSVSVIAALAMTFLKVPYFLNGVQIAGFSAGSFLNLVFFHVLLRQPRRLLFWVGGVPVLLPIACFFATYEGLAGIQYYSQWAAWCYTPYAIAVVLLIFRAGWGGNREAWLLFVPFSVGSLFDVYDEAQRAFGLERYHAIASLSNFLQNTLSWPIHLSFGIITGTACNFAVCAILILRFARSRRDEERLSAELEAARAVQQILIPERTDSLPGFSIESVYLPAQQVGGDFFQVLPASDGGMLLVLGDVAGKGLPAAMLVAVLVGAARSLVRFTNDPAQILEELNDHLVGRAGGGFSTCLAAHISAVGKVTIANAGHLPPYLDGREIDLPGALPLGIARGVRYESCSFDLHSGKRLTFYSDGVVEAQSASGELFGFDRSRELSTRPAAQIVEAARAFGQKDDITVVTLAFSGATDAALCLTSV